jgi:hypothetical protein
LVERPVGTGKNFPNSTGLACILRNNDVKKGKGRQSLTALSVSIKIDNIFDIDNPSPQMTRHPWRTIPNACTAA